ncbi:MAG TPA: GNAT family N-acetyltransferase [Deinococcales bacterium]|nr:GNAT family N-acetyltransferase [Deinococcales bacterium]
MRVLPSPYGPIELWPCAGPDDVARYELDESMRAFRPPALQHEALVGIAELPDGCLTFARAGHRLVGYAAFHPPDPIERWSESRVPGIIELGAVETAAQFRGRRLARSLLEVAIGTGRFEGKLLIATLYHWHYDLEGSGLSAHAYRKLLERLYSSVGFQVVKTDDPEIAPYPSNSLMVRVGRQAPPELLSEFERLRMRGVSLLG